jgi:hypothetical protein
MNGRKGVGSRISGIPRPSPSLSTVEVEEEEKDEEVAAAEDVVFVARASEVADAWELVEAESVPEPRSLRMEFEPGRSVENVEVAEAVVVEAFNSIADGSENRFPCPQQSYCVNSSSI